MDKVAVLVKRPKKAVFNDDGVLHCENGPAIVYEDGYESWVLNGQIVDEETVARMRQLKKLV